MSWKESVLKGGGYEYKCGKVEDKIEEELGTKYRPRPGTKEKYDNE